MRGGVSSEMTLNYWPQYPNSEGARAGKGPARAPSVRDDDKLRPLDLYSFPKPGGVGRICRGWLPRHFRPKPPSVHAIKGLVANVPGKTLKGPEVATIQGTRPPKEPGGWPP